MEDTGKKLSMVDIERDWALGGFSVQALRAMAPGTLIEEGRSPQA
jgi:hypothetical protein